MTHICDANPLGLDGFVFVEFTSPESAVMKRLIEQLGFVAASLHPSKTVTRRPFGPSTAPRPAAWRSPSSTSSRPLQKRAREAPWRPTQSSLFWGGAHGCLRA